MSSRITNFTNTIHIRDFVLDVGPDHTRSDSSYSSSQIEIQSDINIFEDDDIRDSSIIAEPIHACLRVFIKDPQVQDLYIPDSVSIKQTSSNGGSNGQFKPSLN